MAGDALVAALTDESGSRPAYCNSEIPSWPGQIWSHSRFMEPIYNKPETSLCCQLFQSLWKKATGQTEPRQPAANLYENVQFDLSNFISEGRDRWSMSLHRRLADECGSVINNSFAFRPVEVLGGLVSHDSSFHAFECHWDTIMVFKWYFELV